MVADDQDHDGDDDDDDGDGDDETRNQLGRRCVFGEKSCNKSADQPSQAAPNLGCSYNHPDHN